MSDNVDIIVDDKGSADRVKRKLSELGTSANAANDNVGTLNRALGGLDKGFSSLGTAVQGTFGRALGNVSGGIGSIELATVKANKATVDYAATLGNAASAFQGAATATRAHAGALTATTAAGGAQAGLWGRLTAGVRGFTADLVTHYRAEKTRLDAINAGLPIQTAAADATARHGAMARAAGGDLQGMATGARALRTGLAALLSLGIAKELVGITEQSRQATQTLEIMTGSTKGAAEAMDKLLASSQRTNTDIQSNVTFFAELNNIFRSTHRDVSGVVPLMEAFNRTLQLSGASAQQTRDAQELLNKAMLQGGMDAQQLGQLFGLSKVAVLALRDGLGVSEQTLLRMAQTGQLTTGTLIRGFTASAAKVQEMAQNYIPTLGQAWNNVTNSIFAYVNNSETGSRVTDALAKGMLYLSDNMGTIIPIALGVTAAIAGLMALQLVLWAVAVTRGVALLAVEMAVLAARTIATGIAFAIANPATVAFSVAILAIAGAVLYLSGGWDAAKKGLEDFVASLTKSRAELEKTGEKTSVINKLLGNFNGLAGGAADASKKVAEAAGGAGKAIGDEAEKMNRLQASTAGNIVEQRSLADVLKGTTQTIRLASGEWKVFQGDAHTAAVEAEKDFAQYTEKTLANIERLAQAQKAAHGYFGDNRDFDNGMKQNLNGYGGERTGSDRGEITPGMYGSLGVGDGGLFKLTQGGASGTISQIQLNGRWMDVNAYQASAFAWIRQNTKLREFDAYTLSQPVNSATFDDRMASIKSKYGPEDTRFKGFANGGSMVIPTGTAYDIGGQYSVGDKGLVQFRANKGEVVTVTPREKTNDKDKGCGQTITVIIQTQDADSFRRSEKQMLQQFAAKIGKAAQ